MLKALRSPEQAYNIRVASRFMALLCMLCAGILVESIDAQYRAAVKADGGWLTIRLPE
jgi:hypothetical protein